MTQWEKNEIVQRLREYLRIPSVHPNVDYGDCVKFLRKQAAELDLPLIVHEFVAGKPVVIISWEGEQPDVQSILLNSHMDVVPVDEEFWSHPPFEAVIADDGYIYARGVQDMKSVGMIHLETIRRMKAAGVKLKRTVHVSFVPDEEIGGKDGMKAFSESEEFKKLNIGFELDESGCNPNPNTVYVNHGERTLNALQVICKAAPTHGSFLVPNTAGEKITYMLNKFMEFRAQQMEKLKALGNTLEMSGQVTTVNLTQLEGGQQVNVLPASLSASFDVRIAPDVDHAEFYNMISKWCEEAGEGVTFEKLANDPQVKNTAMDGSVPFCNAFEAALKEINITMNLKVCPGATDARYIRLQGVPALSFTPIHSTPTLLHCHNERLHCEQYLNGIDLMEKVVQAVANV